MIQAIRNNQNRRIICFDVLIQLIRVLLMLQLLLQSNTVGGRRWKRGCGWSRPASSSAVCRCSRSGGGPVELRLSKIQIYLIQIQINGAVNFAASRSGLLLLQLLDLNGVQHVHVGRGEIYDLGVVLHLLYRHYSITRR